MQQEKIVTEAGLHTFYVHILKAWHINKEQYVKSQFQPLKNFAIDGHT
jgi:hypothetical protein